MKIKKNGIVWNSISNLITQGINLVLTFLASWYFIKKMGVAFVGEYNYYLTLITMISSYATLGIFRSSINIFKRNSYEEFDIMNTNLTFSIFYSLLITTILLFFSEKLGVDNYNKIILIGLSVLMMFFFEIYQKFFLFKNNIKKLNETKNISNIIKALLLCGLIFYGKENLSFFLIANLIFLLIRNLKLGKDNFLKLNLKVNKAILKDEVKIGYLIFLSFLFSSLNLKIDILFVKEFLGFDSLGIYSTIVQYSEAILLVSSSIGFSIIGAIYSIDEKEKIRKIISKSIKYSTLIVLILSIALIIVSKYVTLIYGDEFEGAIIPLRILSVSCVFQSTRMLYDTYFFRTEKIRMNVIANLIGTLSNIILNLILVKEYHLNGVAIASLLSYFTSMIILTFFYYREREKR